MGGKLRIYIKNKLFQYCLDLCGYGGEFKFTNTPVLLTPSFYMLRLSLHLFFTPLIYFFIVGCYFIELRFFCKYICLTNFFVLYAYWILLPVYAHLKLVVRFKYYFLALVVVFNEFFLVLCFFFKLSIFFFLNCCMLIWYSFFMYFVFCALLRFRKGGCLEIERFLYSFSFTPVLSNIKLFVKKHISGFFKFKVNTITTKSFDVNKKKNTNQFLSIDYGLAYLFLSFFLFFLFNHSSSSLVLAARENFSIFIVSELLLFILLLFAFLSFFNLIKKFQHDRKARSAISKIYLSNITSLFFAYGFLLTLNFLAYTWPVKFFTLFEIFWTSGINLHSHEYLLLPFKIIFILLACAMLVGLNNYLISGKISFQYFNLVILMVWSGLFVISLLNIFYMLLIFDAISLMIVAVIGLSAAPKFEIHLTYALHYFTLSAVTSLFSYGGCILLHNVFNTFNVNAIIFIVREVDQFDPARQTSFILGCTFILIKIFFLLGLFPFYQYVVEVSSAVNYGFLFYFLVVSKLPIFIFLLYIIKLIWLNAFVFKKFILIVSLTSIIFSTLFIATTFKIKHFFALSSINQIGFVVALLAFGDIFGISVSVQYFLVYCLSVAPLLLLLTFAVNFGFKELTDGDLDNWADLARCTHDTYILIKNRRDGNIDSLAPVYNFENFNLFVLLGFVASVAGLITLAGFPPTAGFFLKMSFVEVFLAHHYYLVSFVIILSSLITAYAYTNVIILLQPEFRWVDTNNNLYRLKLFIVSKHGGFLFFSFLTLIICVIAATANSQIFSLLVEFLNLFFYDDSYHYTAFQHSYFAEILESQTNMAVDLDSSSTRSVDILK